MIYCSTFYFLLYHFSFQEAECTRLSAQISGYERAMYAKKADFSPLTKLSSTFSPLTKVTFSLSSPVQNLPQDAHSFHQPSLHQSLSDFALPKEHYITSHPLDLTVKGLHVQNQGTLTPQKSYHLKQNSVLKMHLKADQETDRGWDSFRELPKESFIFTNKFQEAPRSFEGVGTPSFQEMLAYVNRRIREDEFQSSHSPGNKVTDFPNGNVKVCEQEERVCNSQTDSGRDNTMPFISALLANSEEECSFANKTGSRFPRGIDSPSSPSAGSNQDGE